MNDVERQIGRFMAPEHDGPPVAEGPTYLVCSSPRSGSNMLCDALGALGTLGKPFEYLNPGAIAAYRARPDVGPAGRDTYLEFLCARRSSPNGTFGIKIHHHQLAEQFPEPAERGRFLRGFDRIVLLSRRDKLAQALSNARALASGVWFADTAGEAERSNARDDAYDPVAIAQSLAFVIDDDRAWLATLAGLGLAHRLVWYEDLVADWSTVFGALVAYLGDESGAGLAAPRTKRLAGDGHAAWRARFLADIVGRGPSAPDQR